jgi:hypothetical protein
VAWSVSIVSGDAQSRPDHEYLLRRFRAALQAVDESPTEAAVVELRAAAAPLMHQLREEYLAAGHPEGDDAAIIGWLRSILSARDRGDSRDPSLDRKTGWRQEEAG